MVNSRKPFTVQLDTVVIAGLDEVAKRTNESRTALIRRVLSAFVRSEHEREADERLVEAYRKHPQPEPTAWELAEMHAMIDEEPW